MIDIPLERIKPKLKTTIRDGKPFVFDIIRKKYVALQPEELVRQMLVHHLTENVKYPISRFQIERGVSTLGKNGRFDIIIYDKAVIPWMIIECKSHKVRLNQKTLDQLAIYNSTLKAPYFMISNGINTYCYVSDNEMKAYTIISELPEYP